MDSVISYVQPDSDFHDKLLEDYIQIYENREEYRYNNGMDNDLLEPCDVEDNFYYVNYPAWSSQDVLIDDVIDLLNDDEPFVLFFKDGFVTEDLVVFHQDMTLSYESIIDNYKLLDCTPRMFFNYQHSFNNLPSQTHLFMLLAIVESIKAPKNVNDIDTLRDRLNNDNIVNTWEAAINLLPCTMVGAQNPRNKRKISKRRGILHSLGD
ncbi:hypothetical protein DFA_00438 [Cavenderia fasciculata]|uniref:Uncharacterized protein n=1 Tax=Cavenderia fasciculata TaxID=261658 RepID=F4PRS8_CACFS|nr:uncharacterized protein DFA_00438 [Cavenderia fasciculata]EGG20577.1 hypothetical protein DFA_00438 [Cavenderia fasciculata]|eukprot:XP_004358427.1 hypothetical protein DFA_00438 [Cavenderia fasciculata]